MGIVFGKIDVEMPAHIIVHRAPDYQIWKYPGQVAAVVRATDLPCGPDGRMLYDRKFSEVAFPILAKYIGVFGPAQNRAAGGIDHTKDIEGKGEEKSGEKQEAIAMTTPVVITDTDSNASEKVAMTAPVVMTDSENQVSENVAMTAPVVMTDGTNIPGQPIAMTAPVTMSSCDENDEQELGSTGSIMKFLLPTKYKTVADAPIPTNQVVKLEMVADGRCDAVISYSGDMAMTLARKKAAQLIEQLKKDNITVVGQWTFQGYNPPFTLPWLRRNEIHVPIDPEPYANVMEHVAEN